MEEQLQPAVSPTKPLDLTTDSLGLFKQSPEQSTPIPGGNRHTIPGLQSYQQAEAFKSHIANAPEYATNKFQYGQVHAYGADYTDKAFERYYNHAQFNKLGFSPYRDNETIYNENSTGWNDFSRAMSYFPSLMKAGALSAVRSWKDMATGDALKSDLASAKEFDKAMSLGSSSRGGVSGFMSNLFLNAGYTVGIMGELLAEETALAAATYLTGFTAAPGTVGLGVAAAARAGSKLGHLGDAVQGTWKAFKSIQTPEAAKHFYDAAKSTAKFVNPLGNTTGYIKGLNEVKGAEKLAEYAKKNSVFGAFYRDIREVNFALSESKLEGGSTQLEVNKNLTDEFYTKNGRMPSPEEAALISRTSQSAGYATVLTNLPVIYYSNKITFDNLFRGFSPLSKLENEFIDKAGNRILHTAEKGKPAFQHIENSFKNSMKAFVQPKTYAKVGLNYFRANLSEGGQEVLQEVISGSAKDYYTSIYHDPKKAGMDNIIGTIADNFTKQASHQGLETFMSGFLMGGIMGVGGKAANKVKDTAYKTFKPEQYKEYRKDRDEYTKNVVKKLNDIYESPLQYFAPDIINLTAQTQNLEGMTDAMREDNPKAFMDLKDNSVYSHIYTALRSDKYDVLLDRLNSIKEMQPEAIKEAYGVDGKVVLDGIDKVIKRAERIKERYDKVNERFPNPFDPAQFKKGTPEEKQESLNYMAFESAKGDSIMLSDSYDKSSQRMSSIISDLTTHSGFENLNATDITNILDPNTLSDELKLLKSEIDVYKELTDSQAKKDLAKKQKKYDALKEYKESLTEHFKSQLGQGSAADALVNLHKSFQKYVSSLDVSKGHVFNEDVNTAFHKIKDFYSLTRDTDNLSSAINLLHNPESFMEHFRRTSSVMTELFNQRKETIQAGQDAMMSVKEKNTLVNNLFDKGFVISAEDLETFLKDGTIPKEFYDLTNKEVITEESPKYREVADILIKHEEATKEPAVVPTEEELKTQEQEQEAGDKVKPSEVSSLTPWDKLPVSLQLELNTFFNLYLEKYKKENEDFEDSLIPDLRQDWMSRDQEAKGVITNWRIKNELKPQVTVQTKAPKLLSYSSADLENKDIQGLRGVLTILNDLLKNATEAKDEDKLANVEADIQNLNKYIAYREGLMVKPNNQAALAKVIDKIDKTQKDIQGKSEDRQFYIIKGEQYQRVTNVIEPIEKEIKGIEGQFQYPGLDSILEEYFANENKGGSIADFINEVKNLKLKEFNQRKYEALEKALTAENTKENLVNTVNELSYDDSRTAGNVVDDIVRTFFVKNGDINAETDKPEGITNEAFTQLITELRRMQEEFNRHGLTVLTERIVIYDPVNKVAGELDMLLVDEKGEVYIFDVKTSRANKWNAYNDRKSEKSNKIKHELQLSAYSNILYNNYGINVKGLGIIPFEITYDLDGNVTSVRHAKGVSQKETTTGGRIIYASPGLGKSTLVAKSDKYVDGDELLFHYMKSKQIPVSSIQDSGKIFMNYINKKSDVEKEKLLTGIKDLFQASKKAGKIVLTGNWFGREIADEAYLSKDVNRMAQVFMARGQYETLAEAEAAAKRRISIETADFQGKKVSGVSAGTYIEDLLNPQPIRIKLEYNPEVEQAIPRGERKEQPVTSDIEVKKADIEKRRKELKLEIEELDKTVGVLQSRIIKFQNKDPKINKQWEEGKSKLKELNAELAALKTEETPAPVEEVIEEKGKVGLTGVNAILNAANTQEEHAIAKSKLLTLFTKGELTDDVAPLVSELTKKRLYDIVNNLSLKDLVKGQVLLDKNTNLAHEERLMQVIKISDTTFNLRPLNNPKVKSTIMKEEDLVNYQRYDVTMKQTLEQTPKVTKEEEKLSKTVQTQNSDFTSDVNTLSNIVADAEKKSAEDVNNDFLNNLGCK